MAPETVPTKPLATPETWLGMGSPAPLTVPATRPAAPLTTPATGSPFTTPPAIPATVLGISMTPPPGESLDDGAGGVGVQVRVGGVSDLRGGEVRSSSSVKSVLDGLGELTRLGGIGGEGLTLLEDTSEEASCTTQAPSKTTSETTNQGQATGEPADSVGDRADDVARSTLDSAKASGETASEASDGRKGAVGEACDGGSSEGSGCDDAVDDLSWVGQNTTEASGENASEGTCSSRCYSSSRAPVDWAKQSRELSFG